jgi:uncharacterized membrane protein
MKRINLLVLIGLVLFTYACNNNNKTDEEELKQEILEELKAEKELEDDNAEKKITVKDNNNEILDLDKENSEKKSGETMQAQFKMLIASTGGTYYAFKDQTGKTIDFYHDEQVKALEFAMSLRPGDTEHKYYGKWFELTYEYRDITRKGETQSLPVIIDAKEITAVTKADNRSTSKTAFTAEEIKNAVFLGTEPFWDIKFYDNYAEKNDPSETKIKFYYLVDGKAGNHKLADAIQAKSGNSVTITVTDESGGAAGVITITHQNCNDGMSENKYPYTFSFIWEDGGGWSGCGRKK